MIIEAYKGDIGLINSLQQLIKNHYSELFISVIVHGSVATNEVIPYSDFDGLLIVKDNFVDSKKLKDFKRESMKFILKFDPIQHHGWFQISESQLEDYPESYLPISVLENAKSIYSIDSETQLNIRIKNKPDYKTGLYNMLNSLENKAVNKWKPNNLFQLKSFLSQIMLIPCLYFSGKYSDGIFKKDSFEAVKIDFTSTEWLPIETASEIREGWSVQLNFLQRKLLRISSPRGFRKAIVTYLPISIPKRHSKLLNDDFYNSILALIEKIKKEIP